MPHISKSQKLHEDLGKIINAAPPGSRLVSEPELAQQLGVSRATLREAMRTFETQGLIRRRQGSGTYVSHPSGVIDSGLEVLESIETMAQRTGLEVTLGGHKIERRAATAEEAEVLSNAAFTEVISITRVILAESRPAAYLIDVLPVDVISSEELAAGFTGSVLDILVKRDAPSPRYSRTEINAVTATPDIARALGIQRGDGMLRFHALLYSADNKVIDTSYSYFLPGYFRFHVIRRLG
jgi:GntR family transcriptional regulator